FSRLPANPPASAGGYFSLHAIFLAARGEPSGLPLTRGEMTPRPGQRPWLGKRFRNGANACKLNLCVGNAVQAPADPCLSCR
ncbi:MAG: hypothetical protein MPJ50_03280, partial [Pirellulales bacterium]|nr:hypothetical protein [Pirellulales bacterium]